MWECVCWTRDHLPLPSQKELKAHRDGSMDETSHTSHNPVPSLKGTVTSPCHETSLATWTRLKPMPCHTVDGNVNCWTTWACVCVCVCLRVCVNVCVNVNRLAPMAVLIIFKMSLATWVCVWSISEPGDWYFILYWSLYICIYIIYEYFSPRCRSAKLMCLVERWCCEDCVLAWP